MNQIILKWIRRIFGSLFFLGYIPGAPGTIGSCVLVALLWYARSRVGNFFYPAPPLAFWLVWLGLTAISIFLSNDAEATFGRRDAKQIIIDECAGQFIVFFMVPLTVRTLILGLALFRFFDIVKPFPVYRIEELEDGVGITMDDAAAGILANVTLHAVLWTYHAISAWL
jgi:phosphatidylglycerophosphatase A